MRFLTVMDRRFRDWTFIAGGCRKRECFFPLKTAVRELEEETRGLVKITSGEYSYFFIIDIDYPDSVYHIYAINIKISRAEQMEMIDSFDRERQKTDERRAQRLGIRRSHDENLKLNWDSLSDLKSKPKWGLIDRLIQNPRFFECLAPNAEKIPFSLLTKPREGHRDVGEGEDGVRLSVEKSGQ